MWEDPIVAEVRKIREDYAAQFNFDLQAMFRALKEREQQDPRPKVSYSPRPAKIAPKKGKTGAMQNAPRGGAELLLRETAAWDAASDEDALKIEKKLAETG